MDDELEQEVCDNISSEEDALSYRRSCVEVSQVVQADQTGTDLQGDDEAAIVGHCRWGPKQTTKDIDELKKAGAPVKTRAQTDWCVLVWEQWTREHTTEDVDEIAHTLDSNCTKMKVEDLDFWISWFVIKARKKDGSEYPPNTL